MDDYLGHLREFRRVLQNLGGGEVNPLNRGTISSLSRKLDRDESKLNADQIERSIRQTVEAKRTIEELSHYEQDVISVFQEATSKRRRELERERFRKLLDQSGESILVIEPYTGRVLDVNETASRSLGYSRDELLELTLNQVEVGLPLSSASEWHDWVEKLRQSPEALNVDGLHRKRSGQSFPVEMSVGFATVDNEELLLLIARDATGKRRDEKRIKRQWGFFSQVAQNSVDGVWAFDRALNVTYWNPAMEHALGLSRDEVIGKNALDALPQLKEQGEKRFMEQALAGKPCNSRNRFYANPTTGQQIFFEGHYTPLTEGGGEITGAIGVLRDVTARIESQARHAKESKKRVEQQRVAELAMQKRYQREIDALKEETTRLLLEGSVPGTNGNGAEELQFFAGGVASSVSPLMAGILSQTEATLAQLSADSPIRRSIEEIEAAALHTNALAATLGSYSGNGRVAGPRVQLDGLIYELEHSLRTVAGRELTVSRSDAEPLPPVVVEARLIRELLRELVSNASESMEGISGPVRISTGVADVDQAILARAYLGGDASPGRYVFLDVSDSGCGMEELTLSKSFVPFFSTKSEHRGLGLATVLGVMKAHRGLVTIKSVPSKGTSVRAYFPTF